MSRWPTLMGIAIAIFCGGCQLVFQLDGGADGGACSTAAALSEDFSGGFPVQLRIFPEGDPITVVDEVLVVDRDGDTAITTRPYYDLRERTLEVAIEIRGEISSPFSEVGFGLRLARDGSAFEEEFLGFRLHDDGMLVAFYTQDLVEFELGMEPYDPAAHRVWRFAQVGPETIWSAGDGESFVDLARFQLPVGNVQPELFVRRDSADLVEDFRVGFDDLRGGPQPEPTCATSTLVDDFETIEPTRWEVSRQFECPTLPSITGGQLELTWTPGSNSLCDLETWTTFDLAASTLVVEHVTTPRPFEQSFFGVRTMSNYQPRFRVGDGELAAITSTPDSTEMFVRTVDYDPVAHRWLRLRGDRGQLVWETSPDGRTFAFFAQTGEVMDLDAVTVRLGIEGSTAEASPVTTHFDHLNLPP